MLPTNFSRSGSVFGTPPLGIRSYSLRSAWYCSAGVGGLSWPLPPAATTDRLSIRTRIPLTARCTGVPTIRRPEPLMKWVRETRPPGPADAVTALSNVPATDVPGNDGLNRGGLATAPDLGKRSARLAWPFWRRVGG